MIQLILVKNTEVFKYKSSDTLIPTGIKTTDKKKKIVNLKSKQLSRLAIQDVIQKPTQTPNIVSQTQIQNTENKHVKNNLPSQRLAPEMQVSGSLFHSVMERMVFT